MIAVDTSALLAIVLDESEADACERALATDDRVLISAGTAAEAMIIGGVRRKAREIRRLFQAYGFEIIPVTEATAVRIGEIYGRWGKGLHQAALNFGDCFAYDLAYEFGCPLLYVGDDFRRTDVVSAL